MISATSPTTTLAYLAPPAQTTPKRTQTSTTGGRASSARRTSPSPAASRTCSEQTAAIAKAYKAYYAKQGDDPEVYLMDHSTFTYLMAPDGSFLDVFRRDVPPADVADRVQCFAERL